ncbi:Dor1-like family-domain-containing protein [Neohortaea acidophila]|uniref:Conserved oligomeric Golgi complex subunit 8 n=1 Tax=Neohortaea acidophila TaxID=245834 RepID=A0A6A6PJY3_9PEZI|nr:Dor1-like family-domain-containing protein [Neohortaea acidophila]KAF2480319.1 Dor1-like family-domain-containing protein [Neohortaea acidophila]
MDPLYELLSPYFDRPAARPPPNDPQTANYLTRLSTLSLSELTSTEPASLQHSAQSHLRNLQALSKRSHQAVIASTSNLEDLTSILPSVQSLSKDVHNGLAPLENAATAFASKYDRSSENAVLDRRKRKLLLSRNVDRVTDMLDLPVLLSSTVTSAQSASTASTSTSYATALDLHAHIRRLNALYPHSELVGGISKQADAEIQNLVSILITSLQSPSLKLAGAMRAIGWLRRIAPDLAEDGYILNRPQPTSAKALSVSTNPNSTDGALGSLFLVCRLRTLHTTLAALDPLRELAQQETTHRKQGTNGKLSKQQVSASALGSQSERYLKRYIEIFREQSFSVIGMYKSIFPSGLPTPEKGADTARAGRDAAARGRDTKLSSPLSSFALHLVSTLTSTLREYLPNVTDTHARESLLTQVLYCAGSLGRLGADFGMMIALLEEEMGDDADEKDDSNGGEDTEEHEPEWAQVMKKHRIQAGRLEVLARGVGSGGRKASSGSEMNALLSPG